MVAARNLRVYSIKSLNGEHVSEQYKEGLWRGSVADGQEILWCFVPLRKNYSTLKLRENPGGGREPLCGLTLFKDWSTEAALLFENKPNITPPESPNPL